MVRLKHLGQIRDIRNRFIFSLALGVVLFHALPFKKLRSGIILLPN